MAPPARGNLLLLVQYCIDNGIPVAQFPLFRSDPSRNGIDPVIATLVVQLMETFPDLHPIIIPTINADPLIFMNSFETQFRVLIFKPLRQLKYISHAHATLVLLFDGVDECADRPVQMRLIRTGSDCSRKCDYPVLGPGALREPHIAFREPCITDALCTIPLDENYAPATDIRRFVDASSLYFYFIIKSVRMDSCALCGGFWFGAFSRARRCAWHS